MKTIWAAAFVGEQDRLGSLEPGKLADLVILDGDYMTVQEPEISELNVVLTFVGGKKAYSLVRWCSPGIRRAAGWDQPLRC